MAAGVLSRKLIDHISIHKQVAENKLEVGETINPQSPPLVVYVFQKDSTPTHTHTPGEKSGYLVSGEAIDYYDIWRDPC